MQSSKQRRSSWSKYLSPWALVAAGTILLAAPALAATPGESIKNLVEEVLAIIHDPALQTPAQKEQRVARVEKAADRLFDYREMARRCLGDTWDRLSQAQQQEFAAVFTALLKTSFACRLDELAKAQVSYQPEIVKADYTEVAITILRPNDKIPVNFRLLKEPQGWMIYDLVIQGVSLTDNYRSQFARVIQGASYQELIGCLQAKMKEECQP